MQIFRPRSFSFPPSRGPRDGILLRKDGIFIRYGIGPGDAGSSKRGTWRWIEKGIFELKYPSTSNKRIALQILSCSSDELVVRVRQDSGSD